MRTLLGLDFYARIESLLRLRVSGNVLWVQLLWASASYSQRALSSFGPVSDIGLDYPPAGTAWSSSSGQIVVLAQEAPTLYFYGVGSQGALVESNSQKISQLAKEIVAAGSRPPLPEEFALLSADGSTAVLLHKARETFEESTIDLESGSQHLCYGDINSDRRPDLLFYGKKRAGVTPLLKQKDGRYVRGALIFPDLSVSALQCLDLNGDGIVDLFLLNWLSNEIALFYGIGHGVFSEQDALALPGEPSDLAVSPVAADRTVRIAVTIPEEKLVTTFQCNSTGEFTPTGDLRLLFPPVNVRFADTNGDQQLDLVVTTDRAAHVYLGTTNLQFSSPTVFAAGNDVVGCEVTDVDGDSRPDLTLLARAERKLVLYANSNWSGSVQWPATYATGLNPKGIAVMDVNDDGLPDVAVANSGSSSLSIFFNRGHGRLQGQQTVSLPERPVGVVVASSPSPNDHLLLASHTGADKVSIVHLVNGVAGADVAAVPTGPHPEIVLAKRDRGSGHLEMMVRNVNPTDRSQSLSLFQQISGGNFLERSLRASVPGRITALTISEYPGPGNYQLAFVTNEKGARQSALSTALSTDGSFDFKNVNPVLTFRDSTASVRSIISEDIDDDSNKDLVLIMSQPRNALGIVYGRGGGAYSDSLDTIHDAHTTSEGSVIIRDVNGDGNTDLTWIDPIKNAVVTAYGRDGRRFGPPVIICPAIHITAIEVAGLRAPTVQDLLLVNGSKGTLSIMFGPFGK